MLTQWSNRALQFKSGFAPVLIVVLLLVWVGGIAPASQPAKEGTTRPGVAADLELSECALAHYLATGSDGQQGKAYVAAFWTKAGWVPPSGEMLERLSRIRGELVSIEQRAGDESGNASMIYYVAVDSVWPNTAVVRVGYKKGVRDGAGLTLMLNRREGIWKVYRVMSSWIE